MTYGFRRGGGLPGALGALGLALGAQAVADPGLAQTAPPTAPQAAPAKPHKPAARPTPKPNEDEDASVSELVVTGERAQRGAVVGDIKPELQLAPADIQAYGVSTMAELLDELAPQIRSDRGRGGEGPVVLLNGKRVSGFNEIRDIPTEAILRVDILPEEAALKYGYSANQRVVNIVLRPRFRAVTNELTGGGPTEGGQASGQAEIDLFRTRRDARINLDLKYQASSALTEDARDLTSLASGRDFDLAGNVVSPTGGEIDPALSALAGRPVTVAGVPASAAAGAPSLADFAAGGANASDVRRYRTLQPETQQVSLNAVVSRGILGGISATVNATLEATSSRSQQGLPGVSLRVPAGGPFSPFSRDVQLDRYAPGAGPLRQDTEGWTAHLGGGLNRDLKGWRLSLTGAYDHADSQTDSDVGVDITPLQALLNARSPTFNPFAALPSLTMLAQDTARSASDTANIQALASGPILDVPAGHLRASFKVGETGSWFDSSSERQSLSQSVGLSRSATNLQANFDLPLASKRNDFLPALGELSVNLNAAADQVSSFGTLTTLGYGLNWTPVTGLNLIVSHTRDQQAPTMQQLGDPAVLTAGARIFDFATGRTVDVIRVDGGEPGLAADHRDVLKVGLTYKPFTDKELSFTANYVESRIDNAIASLPAATAEIEAAFPERFIRDAGGNLAEVDYRPVNFALETRKELRWGVNYSRPIGPQRTFRRPEGGPPPPEGEGRRGGRGRETARDDGQPRFRTPDGPPDADAGPPPGPPPGEGGGPPRGFGGGGPGGPGGGRGFGGGFGGGLGGAQNGRLQFAIYHTVFFQDEILIRPGVPKLDLLNGSAMGSGGGQPQHEIEAQLGVTEKGLGARLSADWKSGTTVHGGLGAGPGAATGDLTFSDIAKVNLRLFADLGAQRDLVAKHRWLRGSRVTLSVTNLFDQRIQVRDANGATPLSYQAAYLDPLGRVVKLSFRKLIF